MNMLSETTKTLYFWVILILCSYLFHLFFPFEGKNVVLFYLTILLSSVFFATLSRHTSNPYLSLFLAGLSFLTIFALYGLRNATAIDDYGYQRILNSVVTDGWINHFLIHRLEPGYLLSNAFIGAFTDDYLILQSIISFFTLLLFYNFYYKHRKILYLDLAVFFMFSMFLMQMQAVALVRMFIAMGISLYALEKVLTKEKVKFILYVLLAGSFHYSSLFLLCLGWFTIDFSSLRKRSLLTYILFFIIIPVTFIFMQKFLIPSMGTRWANYATGGFEIKSSFLNTVPLIIMLAFALPYINSNVKLTYKLLLFVYSLSLIIFLFASFAGVGRLVFYSYAAFTALVPLALKNLNNKLLFLTYTAAFIIYGFLYVFTTQFLNMPHLPHLIPYENIFFLIK